jgi:hypothetical protein
MADCPFHLNSLSFKVQEIVRLNPFAPLVLTLRLQREKQFALEAQRGRRKTLEGLNEF